MPASPTATHELPQLATTLATAAASRRTLVAIDGLDGSGKTTITNQLASQIRALEQPVVLIHVDDFMLLRELRHRRGRNSPLGYFLDSYDYDALQTRALQPLSPAGTGRDHRSSPGSASGVPRSAGARTRCRDR